MAESRDGGERRDKTEHYRRAALEHPLRRQILRLTSKRKEAGADELAAELDEAPGRISYHLRELVRRDVLKVVFRCRPKPALYRWSPRARWARKMLDGNDEQGRR